MLGYYRQGFDPQDIYRDMLKVAAAVMTPEAMQAGPAGMPPQGAPVDPSMMQGGMPPQGAPMDPSMMQGGMPPMDPSMMQGGMPPADPAMMQGGMPPQGGGGGLPPEILQDQLFLQALQQAGIMVDPASGMAVDQSGQPLPPDMIVQAYQAFKQGQQEGAAGMPAGEAPVAAPAGMDAGMPPAPGPTAGGLGLPEDAMNAISSVVVSAIEPALQDLASQIGQALSDLNAKIDAVVSRLPEEKRDDAEDALRKEIENDLQSTRQQSPLEAEQPQQKAANVRPRLTPINVFSLLNRKN